MASSNVFGSNPKGVKNGSKTSARPGKPGTYTPPSGREHPPGGKQIGGQHGHGNRVVNHNAKN